VQTKVERLAALILKDGQGTTPILVAVGRRTATVSVGLVERHGHRLRKPSSSLGENINRRLPRRRRGK